MEIERLLKIEAENEIEKLVMILSNNTDYGHPNGGMISVKQFYKCADHIMLWHEMQVNKLKQADVIKSVCDECDTDDLKYNGKTVATYCPNCGTVKQTVL
jgi:hypothetical protein